MSPDNRPAVTEGRASGNGRRSTPTVPGARTTVNTRRTKALVLFTAVTAAASVSTASAHATVAPAAEEHCVIETALPKAGSDELQIVATSCFDRFDDVLEVLDAPQEIVDRVDQPDQLTSADMAALGPEATAGAAPETSEEPKALTSTFTIGVHYDATSAAGTSISVTGSNCSGGYINLSAAWNNRVGATKNGCPVIVHWDGFNIVGTNQQTTAPGGPLTFMDNRTSSIQYRS